MLLTLNVTYKGPDMDSDAVQLDMWTSVDSLRGTRRIMDFKSGGTTISYDWSKVPRVLLLDDAVHFQMFCRRLGAGDNGNPLLLPSGHGKAFIADLRCAKEVIVPLKIISLSAWPSDERNSSHGHIVVKAHWDASVPDFSFSEPDPSVDLVPSNMPYIDHVMLAEVSKAIALGNPEEEAGIGSFVEMTSHVMSRVRSRYYTDGTLAHVPGYFFFRTWDYFDTPSLRAIERHMRYALMRVGWTNEGFRKAIDACVADVPFSVTQALAIDTVALGFSVICYAMLYVSDYAERSPPDGASSGLRVVELFEAVLRRKEGDCEDFGKIMAMHVYIVKHYSIDGAATPLLQSIQRLLDYYVPVGCLMTVQGAKVGDGDNMEPDLRDERGAGAHMQHTCVAKDFLLEAGRKTHANFYIPACIAGSEDYHGHPHSAVQRKLPNIQFEGTGNMFSLQAMIALMPSEKEKRVAVEFLNSLQSGYARFFDPQAVHDALKKGTGEMDVKIPPCLQKWTFRRMPHDNGQRTSLSNKFYRSVRLIMPVCEEEAVVEIEGKKWSLSSIDLGTTLTLDGKKTKFSIGVPNRDVATKSSACAAALIPALSPPADKIIQRWRRHLAPAPVLEDPDYTAPTQKEFFDIMHQKLGGKIGPVRATDSRHVLVCVSINERDLGECNLTELRNHLESNPYIWEWSVHCEKYGDDLVTYSLLASMTLQ